MARLQKYGIKYPFTTDNDEGYFLDLNNNNTEGIKSRVLHVIFTPKGQKLRDPEFGTDLIKYIFGMRDESMFSAIKTEITTQISKYVPNVEFRNIDIFESENDDHGVIVSIEYGVKNGNKTDVTSVAVKL